MNTVCFQGTAADSNLQRDSNTVVGKPQLDLTIGISVGLFVLLLGMSIFIYKPRRNRPVRPLQHMDQPMPVWIFPEKWFQFSQLLTDTSVEPHKWQLWPRNGIGVLLKVSTVYAYSVVDFKIIVILFCAGDEVSTFIVELFWLSLLTERKKRSPCIFCLLPPTNADR